MPAKLYTRDGWLDAAKLFRMSSVLNIVIGPRNAGKTYSILRRLLEEGKQFLFVRSTEKAALTVMGGDEINPFVPINRDTGSDVKASKVKGIKGLIRLMDGETPVGYVTALSQIATVRGFSMPDVDVLVYDEFVPHPGEVIPRQSEQCRQLLDLAGTVNRTRELQGREPLKAWLMGNSDNLGCPVLLDLNFIQPILSMKEKGENYRILPNRNTALFLLDDSPIAEKLKTVSAWAAIMQGNDYARMMYDNDFVYDDLSDCRPASLNQYAPEAVIPGLMIMRHNSGNGFYIRAYTGSAAAVPIYTHTDRDRARAQRDYHYLYPMYLDHELIFDHYTSKQVFLHYMDFD